MNKPCSVAKIAADLEKPDGLTVLRPCDLPGRCSISTSRLGDVRAGRRFQASLPTGAVQLTVRLAPVDAGPLCLARMTLFYDGQEASVSIQRNCSSFRCVNGVPARRPR